MDILILTRAVTVVIGVVVVVTLAYRMKKKTPR
jgi:hypothetical protein